MKVGKSCNSKLPYLTAFMLCIVPATMLTFIVVLHVDTITYDRLHFSITFLNCLVLLMITRRSQNESRERNKLSTNNKQQFLKLGIRKKKGGTTTHQKITLPMFERKTIQEAKLWWRRFIQDVKMTHKIDSNRMTTDREIIEEHREELEIKI